MRKATRAFPRLRSCYFFAGVAGVEPVDGVAGVAPVPGAAGVSVDDVEGVDALVDEGSVAGFLSSPPHAIMRAARAVRTRSCFIIIASEAAVFRHLRGSGQAKPVSPGAAC